MELVPERLKGEVARFDIVADDGKVLVQKDKRVTAKGIRDIQAAGLKRLPVPVDFLVGRVLAHDVANPETGELIARGNDEITEELAIKFDQPTWRKSVSCTSTRSTRRVYRCQPA